jgi:hypothetical protein
MRTVYEREISNAAKIEGRIASGADRFVQSPVGPVCRALWPIKTDAHVAAVCGCDPRNARRYMSGEIPIPSILVAAIIVELTAKRP